MVSSAPVWCGWIFAWRIADLAWLQAEVAAGREAGRNQRTAAAVAGEKKVEDLFDTDRVFSVNMRKF
jgi:hypothetical protein